MILHPGILALLSGSLLTFGFVLFSARLSCQVLRYWQPEQADERQLTLERRSYLVSTLINYAFGFSILSLPLFLYTVDDIHPLFVGAMCATGSLNSNPIGWWALFVKMALVLTGGLWVVVNHYDLRAADYPLVRFKSLMLLLLVPLVTADFVLQVLYFLGLKPEIITSCCGSLFSSKSAGLAAEVASFPPRPMMALFYAGALLFAVLLLLNLLSKAPLWRYLLALAAIPYLLLGLTATISFISLYVYELPTHHCPFDMLQKSSNFIGYPIYLGLFGGVLCSMVPGLLEALHCKLGSGPALQRSQRHWVLAASLFFGLFLLLTGWPVVFGGLSLRMFF
ncbi:MAG: hypothetical protein P8Y84_05610 [Desulfuromonadales bacterium]